MFKEEAKVKFSSFWSTGNRKGEVTAISNERERNYSNTMNYLIDLGIQSHLALKVIEQSMSEVFKEDAENQASLYQKLDKASDEARTALGIMDKPKPKSKRFVKPTPQEVIDYMRRRNIDFNICSEEGEKFFNYYESNGWKVGKNPMKNWKAAAANWMKNNNNYSSSNNLKSVDRLATPDRTELIATVSGGQDPFYQPLMIDGDDNG